jgi:hypothetical protein
MTAAGTAYTEAHREEMGTPWQDAANAVSQPAFELAQLIPQVIGAIKQVLHAGNERQINQATTVLTETRRSLYRILADDAPPEAGSPAAEATPGPAAPGRVAPDGTDEAEGTGQSS